MRRTISEGPETRRQNTIFINVFVSHRCLAFKSRIPGFGAPLPEACRHLPPAQDKFLHAATSPHLGERALTLRRMMPYIPQSKHQDCDCRSKYLYVY